MMATLWIVDIMSVMFFISTEELCGIVMIPISQKLVIFQKGFILERVKNQPKKDNYVRL